LRVEEKKSGLLIHLDLGGLGPLEVAVRGAADPLVDGVDDTLAERGELLEGRGGEIDLVRGATGAVVDDANNDRAAAGGDLGALEAGSLLAALVVVHVDGTNVPAIASVDVAVTLQVAVASNGLKVVTLEPGGLAGRLLAELDDLSGLRLLSLDDGEDGDDHRHDENGQLSELHYVSC